MDLKIALPKGRLAEESLELFRRIGLPVPDLRTTGRRLSLAAEGTGLSFLLVKPPDVPIYVEYGVADLGVAGTDTIRESQADVYDALDLGFGSCRMVMAAPRGTSREHLGLEPFARLATKYPRIAESHFARAGLPVEVIALSGSVELACSSGLARLIVDLVETGSTLRENDLVELEVLFPVSARLIVNRASHKLKSGPVQEILGKLKGAVHARDPRR